MTKLNTHANPKAALAASLCSKWGDSLCSKQDKGAWFSTESDVSCEVSAGD